MPLRMELPGPSAAGARRVERWLNTLPGAVALRSANAAPGLSLSASQPELAKTRACTPIETRVTLAGGAHGDATATIPKAISEVVEHERVDDKRDRTDEEVPTTAALCTSRICARACSMHPVTRQMRLDRHMLGHAKKVVAPYA